MKKPPPDWNKIQARYLAHEPPVDILKDYDVTAKQISNKAYQEGWTEKRQQIKEKISELVENDLKDLCDITIRVHANFMRKLEGMMGDVTNPYLFDGERVNGLFQSAMNNSVKLAQSYLKDDNEGSVHISGTEAGTVEIVFKKSEEDSD